MSDLFAAPAKSSTLSLVVPRGDGKSEYILTMNKLKTLHHMAYNKNQQYWREAFKDAVPRYVGGVGVESGGEPVKFAWCDVMVDHIKPTRRNVDVAACLPCVKAGIDGIVLAGVLPDDTPEFVRSLTFRVPMYQQGVEALVITLIGELA